MGRNQRKGGVHLTSLEHLDANIKARKQIVYAQRKRHSLNSIHRSGMEKATVKVIKRAHRSSNPSHRHHVSYSTSNSGRKKCAIDHRYYCTLLLLASTYKRLCHSNSLHQMANLLLLCIADDDIFDVDFLEKHLQSLKEIALYSYL